MFTDPALSADVATRIRVAGDAGATRIEQDFKRKFEHRPTIYVFGSKEAMTSVLTQTFGYPAASAATASEYPGIALSNWVVAVNWDSIGRFNGLTAVIHELTHTMVRQFDPQGRRVPEWLNEGLARLQELTVDRTQWLGAQVKYTAASMARTRTLFQFGGLVGATFRSKTESEGLSAAYAQSAQAAQFVIDEVGRDGLLKILELVTEGQSFRVAYLTVTGKKTYDFEDTFPERALALAPEPGMVRVADAPIGPGPSLLVHGLPSSVPTSITLTAGRGVWTTSGTSTPYGTYFVALDDLPAGTYTTTATGGDVTLRATVIVGR